MPRSKLTELSACPSAAQGGHLGQISRGQTVPEFETFLYNLEVGQICPVPVKTRFGYHVLRLDRRIEGRQLPFEAVSDRIVTARSSAASARWRFISGPMPLYARARCPIP